MGRDACERRGACSVLVRKTDGNRPLAKPGRRGEGNVGMDLNGVGLEGLD